MILAGILFLGHTTIPHHHHENDPCYDSGHSECSSLYHSQNGEDHHHPYDTNNQTHQCCLLEFIPVSGIDISRLGKQQDTGDKFFTDTHFLLLCDLTLIKNAFPEPVVFNPGIIRHYSFIVHASAGLRAPPVI